MEGWRGRVIPQRDLRGGLELSTGRYCLSIHQDGVFLVDLMAEYKVNEKSSALLTINNLFDTEYYSGISVPYHGSVFGDPFKASLSFRVEL